MGASSESLSELRSLDPYEFEHYVADVWEARGWETEVSQQSGDRGIDIVARKTDPVEQVQVIQAKRYSEDTTVGGPDIQQYASLHQQVPEADVVVVVTTGRFTSQAEQLASELNVKLVDGQQLLAMAPEDKDDPEEIEAVVADSKQSPLITALGVVVVGWSALLSLSLGHEPQTAEDYVEATVKLIIVALIAYVFLFQILPQLLALGVV